MGITLTEEGTNATIFSINFWHWRAIVEAVRSLEVLPDARVFALHELSHGELTESESRIVATAIQERLLPTLADDERLLLDARLCLDAQRTTEPDDGTLYRLPSDQHKNYSTTRAVLAAFAKACATCRGFRVM